MPKLNLHKEPLNAERLRNAIMQNREHLDISEHIRPNGTRAGANAPLKFITKLGRKIYFHKSIKEEQVEAYEKAYAHFEQLVADGKFAYNPLTKMYFRRNKDGTYYAFDTHAGETLFDLMMQVKFSQVQLDRIDLIISKFSEIMHEIGISHGHLHPLNICIDEHGQVKIIDISLMKEIKN